MYPLQARLLKWQQGTKGNRMQRYPDGYETEIPAGLLCC